MEEGSRDGSIDLRQIHSSNAKQASYLQAIQNPFSYLDIKNKSQPDKTNDISRNLKVTLDILTKMHYQDFNNAGDKK
jgi:hypothetical protein